MWHIHRQGHTWYLEVSVNTNKTLHNVSLNSQNLDKQLPKGPVSECNISCYLTHNFLKNSKTSHMKYWSSETFVMTQVAVLLQFFATVPFSELLLTANCLAVLLSAVLHITQSNISYNLRHINVTWKVAKKKNNSTFRCPCLKSLFWKICH